MRVVQLVDSLEYARSNCYQRQLLDGLQRVCGDGLVTLPITDMSSQHGRASIGEASRVLSCLRQRTLDRHRHEIAAVLQEKQLTVYDQDPWQAFMPGAHMGAYARIAGALNVRAFAVTTWAWEGRLRRLGFKSLFVPMGILPNLCSNIPVHAQRSTKVGFVGSIHGYRRELFDSLCRAGVDVVVMQGGLSHDAYLQALSQITVYVHRETLRFAVENEEVDLAEGLWVKDVEAIGRGCISIRNCHENFVHHMPAGLLDKNMFLYDDNRDGDAVETIRRALDTASDAHAAASVETIVRDDAWLRAAQLLVT